MISFVDYEARVDTSSKHCGEALATASVAATPAIKGSLAEPRSALRAPCRTEGPPSGPLTVVLPYDTGE